LERGRDNSFEVPRPERGRADPSEAVTSAASNDPLDRTQAVAGLNPLALVRS